MNFQILDASVLLLTLFLLTYPTLYSLLPNLYSLLLGELEVSGEEEKGEGDADGDEGGEDEIEPEVTNADAPSFDDHEH